MSFTALFKRARMLTAVALISAAGGVVLSAAPAHAGACNNEPVPGDVWVQSGTVLVGVDTGLNNPLGSLGVCVEDGGPVLTLGTSGVDDARTGASASAFYCIFGTCTSYLGRTGAEVGTPVVTGGTSLLCVG